MRRSTSSLVVSLAGPRFAACRVTLCAAAVVVASAAGLPAVAAASAAFSTFARAQTAPIAPASVQQDEPVVLRQLRAAAADGPVIVAHRGASEDFPENTLAALRAAVDAKAPVVEFDVWQTKDGAWVLLHDATCDRTTDAARKLRRSDVRIDQLTLAEARELDAGAWKGARFAGERLPTLAEALAAVRPVIAMVERKGGDALAFVAELRRLDAIDRVVVQAFDWDWLEAVHRAEPRLLVAALGSKEPTPARLADLPRTGAQIVHWDHRTLDAGTAQRVRAGGRMVCVYTVDADVMLLGAQAIGCDLITTNRPARWAELRALGLPRGR
jgi:glycerophosphoryl diester phosphodiesterase